MAGSEGLRNSWFAFFSMDIVPKQFSLFPVTEAHNGSGFRRVITWIKYKIASMVIVYVTHIAASSTETGRESRPFALFDLQL